MKRLLSLILFALFSFALTLNGEKQLVYCLHTGEGDIHLEVAHADCSVKKDEIHLKALEDWNFGIEKLGKLVSAFYYLTVKDNFTFLPRIPSVFNKFTYAHDPPLSSVKLLI